MESSSRLRLNLGELGAVRSRSEKLNLPSGELMRISLDDLLGDS